MFVRSLTKLLKNFTERNVFVWIIYKEYIYQKKLEWFG